MCNLKSRTIPSHSPNTFSFCKTNTFSFSKVFFRIFDISCDLSDLRYCNELHILLRVFACQSYQPPLDTLYTQSQTFWHKLKNHFVVCYFSIISKPVKEHSSWDCLFHLLLDKQKNRPFYRMRIFYSKLNSWIWKKKKKKERKKRRYIESLKFLVQWCAHCLQTLFKESIRSFTQIVNTWNIRHYLKYLCIQSIHQIHTNILSTCDDSQYILRTTLS